MLSISRIDVFYSELIQAIEKDYKGIRRKTAQAAKAEGPFPTAPSKQTNKKPNPANILEQIDKILDAIPTSRRFIQNYESNRLLDSTCTLQQQSVLNPLRELPE